MTRLSPCRVALALAAAAFAAHAAWAQEPVKIGMITTLSTAGGYLGEDARDGFQLAIDQEDGKLGGVPVKLLVEDDGLKPGTGKQVAQRFLKSENVKLFTGIIFSNVAVATVPDVLDADAIYVSSNAGPSNFAGRDCHRNYFVASWQTDSVTEAAGQYATNLGFRKMVVLAPNYQAGKDAVTGFKRFYKGEVVAEIYTRLDQTDFASEIAKIRSVQPDAVFQFLPGGLGITFLKQYAQAGLKEKIPLVLSNASLEQRILKAVGDAAVGIHNTAHWNADIDNPANKRFVADFQAKYHRAPTFYAAQGYDSARLIGSALKVVKGDVSKLDGLRAALAQANFESVRGPFRLGPNRHPVQDWYALKVEKGAGGEPVNRIVRKVFTAHQDAYVAQCQQH